MDIIAGLLQTSILAGGVLALAALGEVLAERVGVVNLGVEGLMALGAITAIATVIATPSPTLGFILALAVGLFVGMIFAGATVILRANQVLCGLALTLMGTGPRRKPLARPIRECRRRPPSRRLRFPGLARFR